MSGTPAGWYPDAQGVTRWFDGTSWTEHTRDAGPPSGPPPGQPDGQSYQPSQPSQPPASQPAYGGQMGGQPGGWSPQQGGPAYGAPSYGGPGGPGGGSSKTGLLVGLGALALVLVVGLVVTLVLVLGGDDEEDRRAGGGDETSSTEGTEEPEPSVSEEPAEVAEAFLDAAFAADCETAESLVTEEYLASEGDCEAGEIDTDIFEGFEYEVGTAEVSGEAATVPVTLTQTAPGDDATEPASVTAVLEMVLQDDAWLIDGIQE